MTFLYLPKPYCGLRSAAKSLKPVETTTAPTSTSSSVSRAWRSMQPSTGQAFTHSSHSEQTAQSMQRPAPARASASVSGASTSAKSTRRRARASCRSGVARPERVRLLAGEDLLLVHDRQPSRRSRPAAAAGQPAVDHVRGPAALADGARDVGGAVHHVAGGEDVRDGRLERRRVGHERAVRGRPPTWLANARRVRRHADRGDDDVARAARARCPGSARGGAGPEASGSPRAMRVQRRPLTAPARVAEHLGRGDQEA